MDSIFLYDQVYGVFFLANLAGPLFFIDPYGKQKFRETAASPVKGVFSIFASHTK
ncbi:hypothetical protein [Arenibacter nanhaiticus]|uniref:hypothetical protein n=1 Tax=Arenibacter nanhaiticus TaxID=558155 RepID=UPI0015B58022|nr:hypothetical protein [Arenibacter nanhaiticus]